MSKCFKHDMRKTCISDLNEPNLFNWCFRRLQLTLEIPKCWEIAFVGIIIFKNAFPRNKLHYIFCSAVTFIDMWQGQHEVKDHLFIWHLCLREKQRLYINHDNNYNWISVTYSFKDYLKTIVRLIKTQFQLQCIYHRGEEKEFPLSQPSPQTQVWRSKLSLEQKPFRLSEVYQRERGSYYFKKT